MAELVDRLRAALGDAYRIERELGGGGMSRLFLATEASLGRLVVIKLLPPEFTSEVSAARFEQEIRVAANLQHPNILPVLTAGTKADLLYYIMPYVSGESLRHRLVREGKLPVADANRILAEVADALAYAHAEGVIHRDIKPENILLQGGHAVLTDFGVARALAISHSGGRLTDTGMALGTPGYMSPEQAAGERDIDARSDVYALAVVGYEILTGAPPFEGPSAAAVMAAHLTSTPRPLSDLRPDASKGTVSTITRALAKDPNARLRTASEFRDGMAPPTQSGAPVFTRPWAVAAAVALIVAAAGIWWWSGAASRDLDPNVVAVVPFRLSGANQDLAYLREGMVDLLGAKLTGEGGPRAVDPRSVMSRSRRMGSSGDQDLSEEQLLRLAEDLHAGQLLLGSAVISGGRLTLNATLRRVPDGRIRAHAEVEGALDGLQLLVDQLTAELIARGAGEDEGRLSVLTSTSLPALREYLMGQADYRRGLYREASDRFAKAMELDSTFALAGLGFIRARAWMTGAGNEPGYTVAWRHRDRLSKRDRMLAFLFDSLPEPPSLRERLAKREEVAAALPDQPEAWHSLGDALYHYGAAMGVDSPLVRSRRAFNEALRLDPDFSPSQDHLHDIAFALRDTVAIRTLAAGLPAESIGTRPKNNEAIWLVSMALGDSATVAAIRTRLDQLDMFEMPRLAQMNGLPLDDAERYFQAMLARPQTPRIRWGRTRELAVLAMNRGQPARSRNLMEQALVLEAHVPPGPRVGLTVEEGQVWDALFAEGDTAVASRKVRMLGDVVDAPLKADTSARDEQLRQVCTVALWNASKGSPSTANRAVARLRVARPQATRASKPAVDVCIAMADALISNSERRPDLARKIGVLDSLSRTVPFVFELRTHAMSVALARLFEANGDFPRALAAARRRWRGAGANVYLATLLRLEGRLASRTGDREGAGQAYRIYLALRSDPEPSVAAQVDSVRREVAELSH